MRIWPHTCFIHGFGATRHKWERLFAYCPEAFPTHAVELPGHGGTYTPDHKYSIDILYQAVEEHAGDAEVLVGHSMGGYLAIMMAYYHPEIVRKLILINPLFAPDQLTPPVRIGRRALPALVSGARHVPVKWAAKTASLLRPDVPEAVISDIIQAATQLDPQAGEVVSTLTDLRPIVERLDIPTLVLWGTKDLMLRPALYPELIGKLKEGKGICLEGADHILHLTHPEWTWKQIEAFIEESPFEGS